MDELHSRIKSGNIDELFKAMLTLEDIDEFYKFFEDICTVNEIQSMAQRFEVAVMLKERKTYIEIADTTGASTATISRVNRSLNYGSNGYKLVFERMNMEKYKK